MLGGGTGQRGLGREGSSQGCPCLQTIRKILDFSVVLREGFELDVLILA